MSSRTSSLMCSTSSASESSSVLSSRSAISTARCAAAAHLLVVALLVRFIGEPEAPRALGHQQVDQRLADSSSPAAARPRSRIVPALLGRHRRLRHQARQPGLSAAPSGRTPPPASAVGGRVGRRAASAASPPRHEGRSPSAPLVVRLADDRQRRGRVGRSRRQLSGAAAEDHRLVERQPAEIAPRGVQRVAAGQVARPPGRSGGRAARPPPAAARRRSARSIRRPSRAPAAGRAAAGSRRPRPG